MYSYYCLKITNSLKNGRLNPYSGGKCIPIKNGKNLFKHRIKRLNPYSGGKCIPIWAVLSVLPKIVAGLNPYSGGKCIPI